QKFKNLNFYHDALRIYLRASTYSKDLNNDKLVWFCENTIGTIYARLDDFDKAILYYKKCIPYLSSENNFGNLSRLYKEIGRSYMWLGRYNEMYGYLNQGIEYGLKSEE